MLKIEECLQYGLPFKIDYHKKIQNGLPFQIIIRKVVYFEDINCLKWTTITLLALIGNGAYGANLAKLL